MHPNPHVAFVMVKKPMNTNDRFAELWTNYLEGDLTDEGLVELRALFASHPELMTAATELYQLHRMLGLMSQEDSSAFVS